MRTLGLTSFVFIIASCSAAKPDATPDEPAYTVTDDVAAAACVQPLLPRGNDLSNCRVCASVNDCRDGFGNLLPNETCSNGHCRPRPANQNYQICGGPTWTNGIIPYTIQTTEHADWDGCKRTFSAANIAMIHDVLDQWKQRSGGAIRFEECATFDECEGKPISERYIPTCYSGTGDQTNPNTHGNLTRNRYLSPNAQNNFNLDRQHVAHETGHDLDLPHTWLRYDRDRYVRLNSDFACITSGDTGRCSGPSAWPPQLVGEDPRVATGTFGVWDSQSAMNYSHTGAICEDDLLEPADTDGPTRGDGSAIAEYQRTLEDGWSNCGAGKFAPFVSLGRDLDPTQPLSPTISDGVTMVGSPASAYVDVNGVHQMSVFIVGSDGRVYEKHKLVASGVYQGWSSWTEAGPHFYAAYGSMSRVAASWGHDGRTHLVTMAPGANGAFFYSRWENGQWTAPSVVTPFFQAGVSTTPAVAAYGNEIWIIIRSDPDGTLYTRRSLDGGHTWIGWQQLPIGPGGAVGGAQASFGSPSAVSRMATQVDIVVHGPDHVAWTMGGHEDPNINIGMVWGQWFKLDGLTLDNGAGKYTAPLIASPATRRLDVWARDGVSGLLFQTRWLGANDWTGNWDGWWRPIGGLTQGDPTGQELDCRIDLFAIGTDNNLFWKFSPFTHELYYPNDWLP